METNPTEPPPSEPSVAPLPIDQLPVNLRVVSPHTGFNQPIPVTGLLGGSTVRQMKERIRQSVPGHPAEARQKVIYRGRILQRDDETMLEVFGEEMLRTSDQQSIHLVIRDHVDTPTPSSGTPIRGRSPAPGPNPGHPYPHHRPMPFGFQQPAANTYRRVQAPFPTHPNAGIGAPQPLAPGVAHQHFQPNQQVPANLAAQQAQAFTYSTMPQWVAQLQREAMGRAALLSQHYQQHGRAAAMGQPAAGTPHPVQGPATVPTTDGVSRSSSPFQATASARDGISPTRQRVHLAVNDGNGPGYSPSPLDVQRATDASIRTMAEAMQRSASQTSLGPFDPSSVGVTTPVFPFPMSGRTTPNLAIRTPNIGAQFGLAGRPPPQQTAPEVYILSSPQGPRGLLINGNGGGTYYTPTHITTTASVFRPPLGTTPAPPRVVHPHFPNYQNMPPAAPQQEPAPPVPGPPADNIPAQAPAGAVPPPPQVPAPFAGQPNHAAMAPFIARAFQHFWLIGRLMLFIWWFTTPTATITRWFTVVAIAFGIFIFNTGFLDGLGEHAWRVVHRQMENLIPFADPIQAQNQPPPAPPPAGQQQAANRIPDPAEAAARLVQQRRRLNGERLLNHVRRAERAGLLFLASIAPGVAERHIARLEVEATRQRLLGQQAQQAQEAAAQEAAAQEAAAQEAAAQEGSAQEPGAETNDAGQPEGAPIGDEDNLLVGGPAAAAAPTPLTTGASPPE